MINLERVRVGIVEVFGSVVSGIVAYPAAPHGPLPEQFLIVGMPSWREPIDSICLDRWEWPVLVVVGRPGTNDTATAERLQALWPQVVAALQLAIQADQSLGGICAAANVTKAEFGTVDIQGKQLPCQTITLQLYGG